MSSEDTGTAVVDLPAVETETVVTPTTRKKENPRRQPPYNVVLWNDDDHTVDYVVHMMQKLFGHTVEQCREAGLPVVLDENSGPDTMPWLAWNFIAESKVHGTLIELATRYQAVGDKWYPHPGNAENKHLLESMRNEYHGS